MAVAAVVHQYVFPAATYKRGERCVRNVAVMSDYASLGTEPAPDEVRDCEKTTKVRFTHHDDIEKRMKLHQSVRDVVVGSGEIVSFESLSIFYYYKLKMCRSAVLGQNTSVQADPTLFGSFILRVYSKTLKIIL